MKLTDAVIARLKKIQEDERLSIGEWAMRAGIGPNTFYAIMNGSSRCPKISTLLLLCQAVDMTLDVFFDDPDIENSTLEE